ncbi:MAG TPA: DegT/DnrJ/EryC1/StrS family aminotransferase, partial [Clostridia bacterium]|nr:DegT/DnrJ/EryC1/StrS family aminotransferase [Clostridia bacterium]
MCEQNRKDDQQRTPLVDALYKQLGRVSFHMPGHRQGRIFSRLQAESALALDTTELDRTGDLAQAEGHVLDAYQLAARFFGAARTWFISSGTTTSIFIMMATALQEGDKVILPRALHLAAVHAVAILGLEPIFVSPRQGQVFPDGQPDEAAYLETIRQHPQARACLVTRPDY